MCMSTRSPKYFIWILLHVLLWLAAMSGYIESIEQDYWRLLGLSAYFLVFFLMPLFVDRKHIVAFLLSLSTVFAVITVFPLGVGAGAGAGAFNPFIILILTLLTIEMAHRIPWTYGIVPAALQVIGVGLLAVRAEFTILMYLFLVFYYILLFGAASIYNVGNEQLRATRTRYDALITEFRRLKRRLGFEEELVRQEERKLIGHEIHDSVGHKLTALIMQLESFRLQAQGEQDQEKMLSLKQLAQHSLDETRRAVQTFKHEETGGLQGIIRLIRKLESDSFLRIRFTVDHGAFSAPLTGEQSFIIYRSVQEAMTNIMKHSKAREAKVVFEAPGNSVFRFEISNPITKNIAFKEGFGLTSMRERLQNIDGDLDVFATANEFVVRGWVRLVGRRDEDD